MYILQAKELFKSNSVFTPPGVPVQQRDKIRDSLKVQGELKCFS